MKLNLKGLSNKEFWDKEQIEIPGFDILELKEKTFDCPTWVHFGAGNIFRAFVADIQQELLESRNADTGIIAVDTFDYDIIDRIYTPYDNLTMAVFLYPDGNRKKKVIGSVTEGLKGDSSNIHDFGRLKEIFRQKSLQMLSFTITEKGYVLKNMDGSYFSIVEDDMKQGPKAPKHAMSMVAALLLERYRAGKHPLAAVSMDNCSRNGEKLGQAVTTVALEWVNRGLVETGFLDYLRDESFITFPWSMIDKITPRPADEVRQELESIGLERMEPIVTSQNTYIAPFVNAEVPRYLIIEDKFPGGRPPLDKTNGIYMTDRDTVNNTERMKVTACLNPLHTALAVFGCLFGYNKIADEMNDDELLKLVERIGYQEGMPVVVHPGILDPLDFINEVINIRFPNPFILDMPHRIATDTSQKMAIRFGETIKAYVNDPDLDPAGLVGIPLAIAGWCRYLLGVDDHGNMIEISSDPILDQLKALFDMVKLGDKDIKPNFLKPLLSNDQIFGIDLYEAGLGERIEGYFKVMIAAPGMVRVTLRKNL